MTITDIRCTMKSGAVVVLHDHRGRSRDELLQAFMTEAVLSFVCTGTVAMVRTADVSAVEINQHELPKNMPMRP